MFIATGSQKGFTLIEAIVSIFLVIITAFGMGQAFVSMLKLNLASEVKSGAIFAAATVLDKIRKTNLESLPVSGLYQAEPVAVNGKEYLVETFICLNQELCSSPSIKQISLNIYYDGLRVHNIETVYAQLS
ncbi:MAG TPA: type II secretion system protein [Oligoflexia bacterium]|nr:type II secretion system protein [Oligoflexia bacterium]HMP26526.1 type II secretion system protein [Oligoflexia bacterium]